MSPVHAEISAHSDDESLFGSPPPSPGGRGTPTLALPSGGLYSEQNVGTLALPGLHNFSELAVTPPAVSLVGSHRTHPTLNQSNLPSRSTSVRASSVASSSNVSQPERKRKRARESSSTPRPDQPSIELPQNSDPLPPNFLRNQQALLGLAGVVGGVNPASLSLKRHTRGTNLQNPIVIDDEREHLCPEHSHVPRLRTSNAPCLPTPTPGEVFHTLVNQKNLYPVLESILKLVARDSAHPEQPHPLSQNRDGTPASKRRRMADVPAGAADWDTPYPFPPGDGPTNYQDDWSKDRAKNLISELVGLIRSAAQKAAATGHSQAQDVQHYQNNINGHYRSSTAAYGNPSPLQHAPQNAFGTPHPSQIQYDQLVASMFEDVGPSSMVSSTVPPNFNALISMLGDAVNEQTGPEASGSNPLTIPDCMIDPALFGLTMSNLSQNGESSSTAGSSTPAMSASPMHSSSSTDPVTPNFDVNMFTEPEIASGDPGWVGNEGMDWNQSMNQGFLNPTSSSFMNQSFTSLPSFPSECMGPPNNSSLLGPSLETQLDILTPTPALSTTGSDVQSSPSLVSPPPIHQPTSKRTAAIKASRSAPISTSANATKQRDRLIQRAKEMRRQLVAEIDKSKVEMWEMTIEHGALAQLAKDDKLT